MEINNNQVNDALKKMWEAAKNASEKIAQSNKKTNELQAQFDFLENTIKQKNKINEDLTNKIQELEKNINEKNERITSQYAEIDKLFKQQEKYSEIETSYFSTVNENRNLKNELENFVNQKQELEKIYAEYQIVLEKFQNNENENNHLKKKILAVEKEIKDFEIAKKELLNNRHEIINRNEQIATIKIQLAESQSIVFNQNEKIKNLEKSIILQNENIKILNEKNNDLNEKNNKNDEKINQIIAENNIEKMDLIAKNSALKNELNEFSQSKKQLENLILELEKNIEAKESFNEIINSEISEKTTTVNEYKNIIQQYEKENFILNQLLKNAEENYENSKKQLQKNSEINLAKIAENNLIENKKLEEKIEDLKKENFFLNEKNKELQQKIILSDENDFSNYEKNSNILNEEKTRLLDIIAVLNDELSKTKNEQKNTFSENSILENENKSLKNELQKVQKLTVAFENLKQTNETQTENISKLKNELKYYKKRVYDDESLFVAENVNLLGDVEIKYKQEIDDLNLELQRILHENNFLMNELKERKNEIENQKKEFENLLAKNISTVKNTATVEAEKEIDKNELMNKLENFVLKLSEKLG